MKGSSQSSFSLLYKIGYFNKIGIMEEEIWKDIKGYEGVYQVSNKANVRMLEHYVPYIKGSLMKIRARDHMHIGWCLGYRTVWLCKNKIRKLKKVHRLVAEAFIPNPDNKPYIDHINTIRSDNRIENLRWCTHKENANNTISRKKMSSSSINKPKRKENIIQLSTNGEYITTHLTMWRAAKYIGKNKNATDRIGLCCRGHRKEAYGFKWMYKSDYDKFKKPST